MQLTEMFFLYLSKFLFNLFKLALNVVFISVFSIIILISGKVLVILLQFSCCFDEMFIFSFYIYICIYFISSFSTYT